MSATANAEQTTSIVVCGLGGQGILVLARILTFAGQQRFGHACRSEFRGLSQRNGSVHSTVRFGPEPVAPVLDRGEADLVLALDALEAARVSGFKSVQGCLLTHDSAELPFHLAQTWQERGGRETSNRSFQATIQERLDSLGNCYRLNLVRLARTAGASRAANMVLLGAASWFLPLAASDLCTAIGHLVDPDFIECNMAAFETGRKALNERFSAQPRGDANATTAALANQSA